MMTKANFGIAVFAAAVCLSGCGPEAGAGRDTESDSKRLVLTGSSTCAPLITEIGKRFEGGHPGVRIEVRTGGSARGIADARGGVADVGMASRRLTKEEREGLPQHTLAQDGVCLIGHRENPIEGLDSDTIRSIYRGEVSDWSKVGGKSGEITVVSKASGRATLDVFLGYLAIEERDIESDVIIGDNQQAIETVAGNPGAIGYVSIGAAEFAARTGTPIRLLALNGVWATSDNVAAGRYPMSRPLNLVTDGEPEGLAAEFIDYCLSAEVHDLIRGLYFVPVTRRE